MANSVKEITNSMIFSYYLDVIIISLQIDRIIDQSSHTYISYYY